MHPSSFFAAGALALLQSATTLAASIPVASSLPIVDLGYVKQQASAYDNSTGIYDFSNIAYAQPPLGDLRWAAPKPPLKQTGVKNGGTRPNFCLQAWPKWLAQALNTPSSVTDPVQPYDTEDCLYLNVFVPEKVFNRRNDPSYSAPVIVWIYGGVYVIGSKDGNDPTGLITKSKTDTNTDGAIFVAMNYRLGHLGFLAGSDYNSQGGVSNLGLMDQKLALEWVRANIKKFGGDAGRITLIGESGGASSVAYQITTPFAGNCSKPYQHAIIQSPAVTNFQPVANENETYKNFTKALGVPNLAAARKLSTDAIRKANRDLIEAWAPGTFHLMQSRDGKLIFDTADKELLAGNYAPSLTIMTSYNYDEGSLFTSPSDAANFTALVKSFFPTISPKDLSKVTTSIYPPAGPNTPYSDPMSRATTFVGDGNFVCHAVAYQQAFNNSGYAYKFSVLSKDGNVTGYHTQDVDYTFYNPGDAMVPYPQVAYAMQNAIVNFATFGNPNHQGTLKPQVPVYGAGHQLLNFTSSGAFAVIKDAANGPRCDFWNSRQN